MGRFHFHNVASSLDLGRLARQAMHYRQIKQRMVHELGIDPRRADDLLEGLVGRALTAFGDSFGRAKSGLLDQIITLRQQIDQSYQRVLSQGFSSSQSPAQIASILENLNAKMRLLDELMEELTMPPRRDQIPPAHTISDPFLREIEGITATPVPTVGKDQSFRQPIVDRSPYVTSRGASHTSRLTYLRFAETTPGSGVFRRNFSQGHTDLRIVNGQYELSLHFTGRSDPVIVREFQVLTRHGSKPRMLGQLMQSHHGMQNELMHALFGGSRGPYRRNDPPTIFLRNQVAGSPHGRITSAQNSSRSRASSSTTFADIRRWAIADLKLGGATNDQIAAYFREFDAYFIRTFIDSGEVALGDPRLGGWTPHQPLDL